jgi:hypothetical protein
MIQAWITRCLRNFTDVKILISHVPVVQYFSFHIQLGDDAKIVGTSGGKSGRRETESARIAAAGVTRNGKTIRDRSKKKTIRDRSKKKTTRKKPHRDLRMKAI